MHTPQLFVHTGCILSASYMQAASFTWSILCSPAATCSMPGDTYRGHVCRHQQLPTILLCPATNRVVVALVIVVVNTTLRNLLTVLVKWEQHWTHSGEEKAYGVLSFASQALNTVVVPLLASMRLHAPGALQATEKHW